VLLPDSGIRKPRGCAESKVSCVKKAIVAFLSNKQTNKQTNNRVNPLDQSSTSRILNDGIETGLNRSSEQNG